MPFAVLSKRLVHGTNSLHFWKLGVSSWQVLNWIFAGELEARTYGHYINSSPYSLLGIRIVVTIFINPLNSSKQRLSGVMC